MSAAATAQLKSADIIVPLFAGAPDKSPPDGWYWSKLTSVARLESGHTPSRRHPEWWDGEIPWIALPDIRKLDGKVAYETSEYINAAGIAHSAARVLPAGTVVVSRTASVGYVTIMGREMATSQDFVNWVCGPELEPRFLMFLFLASRSYFRSLSSGAIHQTVYMPTIESLHVCIPPLSEQKRLVGLLRSQLGMIEQARTAVQEQLRALEKLPQRIFEKAFSGIA